MLRDGSTLRLRVPTEADEQALIDFFGGLSTESRYLRFHGATRIDRQTVAGALETDWDSRGSLLGELAAADGGLRPVALATYVRLRDPSRAEVAFAVADDLHGRGIGTRLLERLAAHAAAVGVEELVADVLPQNRAMLRVFDEAGFETRRTSQAGVVEVVLEIRSAPGADARRDLRDHVAVAASLAPFFAPSSVAVVGASPRRGTIGGELFRNILAANFTGAVYPVNRSGEPVGGVAGYASVGAVPVTVDLAVVCVPGSAVLDAARDALESGVKALCVISAGFAETGADGAARQDELLALVRAHGARLVGPNCLGIGSSAVSLNATFARRPLPPGAIAFSSQSGALGLAFLEQADARGLGLSSFVSIGNKADVSSNDLLEYWEEDDETRPDPPLPRVVREPAEVRARRRARRAVEADPRDEERDRAAPARGRRARTPPRSRARTPLSTRSSGRPASCAHARSRSCSTPPRSSPRSRCRAATGSRCSRTRAASASSAPTRATAPASCSPSSPRRHARRCAG